MRPDRPRTAWASVGGLAGWKLPTRSAANAGSKPGGRLCAPGRPARSPPSSSTARPSSALDHGEGWRGSAAWPAEKALAEVMSRSYGRSEGGGKRLGVYASVGSRFPVRLSGSHPEGQTKGPTDFLGRPSKNLSSTNLTTLTPTDFIFVIYLQRAMLDAAAWAFSTNFLHQEAQEQ